jgi:pimeloyl-ACP methyl ester carboxylesterase
VVIDDPIDPPVLLDVPGADAGRRGLPDRSELTAVQRAIVDTSVIADLGLRTAVASMIGAAMLPRVLTEMLRPSQVTRDRDAMSFYADLAGRHNAELSFPAPTAPPTVSSRPASAVARWVAHGNVENLRFDSSFRAINPDMRQVWNGLQRNNVVHAQHWRHGDERGQQGRPTLCVIHGFMGSAYLANGLFFSLPWFYRSGYDVLLYLMPFHGRRAEKGSPFSGYGIFANGMAGFAETMAQAIHDFRSVLDHLEATGVDKVAVTGLSLGGYTSALAACVDNRIRAVIPNVPVVTPEAAFDDWWPASTLVTLGRHASGVSREASVAASAYHSPLNYRPLVPKDRRLIITGLGDRLAPPDQAEKLWEHWDRCALHWFPGNHLIHVSQKDYLRRMTRFLRPVMF